MRNSDTTQGTRGRILFIEDDALMQNMVADVLRASDYECISALDGISGLRLIAETKPDLVLLDLQLGALPTGLDICAHAGYGVAGTQTETPDLARRDIDVIRSSQVGAVCRPQKAEAVLQDL